MCKLAFSHLQKVKVSDEERKCFDWVASKEGITSSHEKLKLRVGTADLLDMLIEQNGSVQYTLALGDDTFMDLSDWKWRRAADIVNLLEGRIVIFRRTTDISTIAKEGKDRLVERIRLISDQLSASCPNFKDNIRIMEVQLSPVSSSAARTSKDVEVLSKILDDKILNYIKENKMYAFCQ